MEEKGRVLELYSSLAQADRGVGSGGDEGGNKQKDKSSKKKKGSDGVSASQPTVTAATVEKRFEVLRGIAEECVTESDLRKLLEKKANFRLYDGFEPSGRMHIAQGTFKAINVNKCTKNGGTFVFWVADWFALMNDKMGGDLEKIKTVGKYLIEVWKAAGMDMTNVEFRWASDDIINNAEAYWSLMLDIAKRFTVTRITKCCQIMGRLEGNLTAAQILYPLMQCTDVFFLKANICQLGLDQRKVNMLAREYCDSKGIKLKPVILSHHMLYGLKKGQEKMSKSDPDSAVFMEDKEEDVRRKIMKAYCPSKPENIEKGPGESLHLVEDELKNPCLDYIQYIVMNGENNSFSAGGKTYKKFADVREKFVDGTISEDELKHGLIDALNEKIRPVREHFKNDKDARELFELVQTYKRGSQDLQVDLTKLPRHEYFQGDESSRSVVVAPVLKTSRISLGSLLCIVECIKAMPKDDVKVLLLPNLSAVACSAFAEDRKSDSQKLVNDSYTILLESLRAIAPTIMDDVKTVLQSELMLSGPSNYWISVINVGRFFKLETVKKALDDPVEVGPVIAALMHVGDIISLNCERLYCCDNAQRKIHELSASYLIDCKQKEIESPAVIQVPGVETKLQQKESENVNFLDDDLVLTDALPDVKRKIKRAFCEPKNTEFNPPLALAVSMALGFTGNISIGESTYSTSEALTSAYASGEIHPSELKPAVTTVVQSHFKKLVDIGKSDPVKSAKARLLQYEKKVRKSRK